MSHLTVEQMTNATDFLHHPTNASISFATTARDYHLLASRIGAVLYPIIYVPGFLGNALALLTFSSRRMRQISSSVFLLVLSMSDTIALITSMWYFLSDAFSIQLQNYSALACRFRTFFAYVFMDLSSWCIAGLAVDRYLRTRFPLNSKTLCTPRRASIAILVMALVLCALNGHYFSPGIGQERGENRTTAHCLENSKEYPNYYFFYKYIWPKIDLVVFCFLPACIMILCNANIVYLVRRQRHHIEHTNGHHEHPLLHRPMGSPPTATRPLTGKRASIAHRKTIERQMSLMMFACTIAFLCTTVPVTICLAFLEHVITKNPNLARENLNYLLVFRILRVLMYSHFGSNFYLYCLTSRMFRTEFMQTITCRRFGTALNQEPSSCAVQNKAVDT